jgi:hypothetical protein
VSPTRGCPRTRRTAGQATFGVRFDPGHSRLPTGGSGIVAFRRPRRIRGRVAPSGRRGGYCRRPIWVRFAISPASGGTSRARTHRRHRTGTRLREDARFRASNSEPTKRSVVRSTSVESCRFRTPPRSDPHSDRRRPRLRDRTPCPSLAERRKGPAARAVREPPAGTAIGGDPRPKKCSANRRWIGVRTRTCGYSAARPVQPRADSARVMNTLFGSAL